MAHPKYVKIVEVGPRDGLQNEPLSIITESKIEFINLLSDTGLSVIEVTSFVSPKWVPQLADGFNVFKGITKKKGVSYPVLIPNLKGLENAIAAGVKDIAVFSTPSQQFSQKNTHCSVEEGVERIRAVIEEAKKHQIRVRGYLSCVLGCPYEGEIDPQKVADLVVTLYQMGCYEISLGDTIGTGTVLKTKRLLDVVTKSLSPEHLAVHFHDTYGQALTNIYAALDYGISVVDSSVAGLGGCPYAKGASGNVATEDVVYMLQGMGIETGIDLKKLVAVGRMISKIVKRRPQSNVNLAIGGPF